jgi:hypothetical protein
MAEARARAMAAIETMRVDHDKVERGAWSWGSRSQSSAGTDLLSASIRVIFGG